MSDQTKSSARLSRSTMKAERVATAAIGGLIGIFLLLGVGFAAPTTIHNAAHDARHANSFPCH